MDADTVSLLNGTYSDLTVKMDLNAPTLSGPYLMDNLVMTENTSDTDSETDTDTEIEHKAFHFRLPSCVGVEEAAIAASDSLRLADGVSASSMPSYVYCDGDGLTEIGEDAAVQAHVYSTGDQFLRERTHIHGKAISEGAVETQNGVTVDGGIKENRHILKSRTYAWDVEFPIMDAGVDLTAG